MPALRGTLVWRLIGLLALLVAGWVPEVPAEGSRTYRLEPVAVGDGGGVIEGGPGPGEALVAPADGVDSTPETGVGGRAQVDPDPAEMLGQVVPDPAVPDPEAGARRNKPSWEAPALNRAKPTRLIPSAETLLGVLAKSAAWGLF